MKRHGLSGTVAVWLIPLQFLPNTPWRGCAGQHARFNGRWCPFLGVLLLSCLAVKVGAASNDFFAIHVLDEQTGRGVPLVELKTDNSAAWWTDSNGIVAFNEPGLMDTEVY